jgi:hypothetical protein
MKKVYKEFIFHNYLILIVFYSKNLLTPLKGKNYPFRS